MIVRVLCSKIKALDNDRGKGEIFPFLMWRHAIIMLLVKFVPLPLSGHLP